MLSVSTWMLGGNDDSNGEDDMTNIEKVVEKEEDLYDPFIFMTNNCPDDGCYELEAIEDCAFRNRDVVNLRQCLKCWLKEVKE